MNSASSCKPHPFRIHFGSEKEWQENVAKYVYLCARPPELINGYALGTGALHRHKVLMEYVNNGEIFVINDMVYCTSKRELGKLVMGKPLSFDALSGFFYQTGSGIPVHGESCLLEYSNPSGQIFWSIGIRISLL